VLSTIVASVATSYASSHEGVSALGAAATTEGYVMAFLIAAVLFGVSAVMAMVLLPSTAQLEARLATAATAD
jgi:hypothetical protein